ncbi:uncharacterized protein LOC135683639 [Rhopilema esculentum]|uniref:uncharacterized protein LOC135683639 n=1 Tax=Rhopilema esculentum TaxID=499914 RepID=UPI0031CDD4D5|eukprot:gene15080-6247_t
MWLNTLYQAIVFYNFVTTNGSIEKTAFHRTALLHLNMENTRLKSGLISKEKLPTVLSCTQRCIKIESCKSINYKASTMECEILSANTLESSSDLLEDEPGWDHHEPLPGRCEAYDREQLCGAEQVCQEDYHSCAGYKCKNLENIAFGRTASQSSTYSDGIANIAVDGNDATNYKAGSCSHTSNTFPHWWRVDFGKTAVVHSVKITNRGDCCGDRLSDFNIVVGNSIEGNGGSNSACAVGQSVPQGGTKLFPCRPRLHGRYLYIQQNRAEALTLCEVRVFGEFLE